MQEATVTQEEAEAAKEEQGKEPFEEENTSTNPEEEETSEEETSNEESQETSKETPDKAYQELEEKNKQLFERAKKAETKLKKSEETSKTATGDPIGDPMEAVRLGKALADITEEEADIVVTYAKGKFNTLTPTPEQIIQASKDEFVTTAISAKRAKVAGDNKTPEPSSPSSVIGGKTEEDLEKMSDNQFAKWFKGQTKGKKVGA